MQYGTVTGRFLAPDGSPLSGSIRFLPDVPQIRVGGADPATILPVEVVATLDAQGRVTHGGAPGVNLVIPEDGVTTPTSWGWRVVPRLDYGTQSLPIRTWSITVPAGGIDLSGLSAGAPDAPALTVTETSTGVYEITGPAITETAPDVYEIDDSYVTALEPGVYEIGA